jgi:anti-anti-sigma regulatory factor
MEQAAVSFLIVQNTENKVGVSFNNSDQLTKTNIDVIRQYITDIITNPGTSLEIDLSGIQFIVITGYDTLNLLSRIARKNGSSLSLTGVGAEVLEIMKLLKKYYVFDIQVIKAA